MKSRIARLVERLCLALRLPPALSGHRYIPWTDVFTCAQEADAEGEISIIWPPDRGGAQLPRNIFDRSELPGERRPWGRSFRDIADRERAACSIVTVPDCQVLAVRGQWDYEHFAVITAAGRRLKLPGMRWLPEHRALFADQPTPQRVKSVVWIWESWYTNHFHWLVHQLPKLLLLSDRGLASELMLPPSFMSSPVRLQSAMAVGVDLLCLARMQGSVLRAERMTFVDSPDFNSSLLRQLRVRLSSATLTPGRRKLYLSRRLASRRRLVNEPEIWSELERLGYEEVCLEELTFTEQVHLLGEAEVVVGLHGAGLANIVFCPEGSHIVEIVDPAFPSPEYYDLAAACGHHYWLVLGSPVGARKPGYHDLYVDPSALMSIARSIDYDLERGLLEV